MTMKQTPRRRRGAFTLLEMLIVIALIGLLVAFAVAKFTGIDENARKDLADAWVKSQAKVPLWSYKRDMGHFPSTEEGLKALITSPGDSGSKWRGPYIEGKEVPLDPWKRPYQYRYPGTKNTSDFDVFSLGPDGVESADDIGNW